MYTEAQVNKTDVIAEPRRQQHARFSILLSAAVHIWAAMPGVAAPVRADDDDNKMRRMPVAAIMCWLLTNSDFSK